MATSKSKPKNAEPDIQLLTTAKCPSISGRSQITSSIGFDGEGEIHIKLVNNSGGGQFSNAWIPFADILKLLERYSGGDAFTGGVFRPLFENQGSNNAGFLLAVALKEKLVEPQEGKRRKYIHGSADAFIAKVDKLKASKKPAASSKKPPRRRKAKS